MTYGIIAALDEELSPLLAEMSGVVEKTDLYGTTFYAGTLRGRSAVLCKCGIATVNAALCAGTMIREHGAGALINTGIAGALGAGVRTLDVVISEDAVYHNRDQELMKKYFPFTNAFKADPALVRRAADAARSMTVNGRPATVHIGRVATGDLFISDRASKEDIVARLHPLCVEMEGAAIAHAAFAGGCPFVIVRTMSDCADESAEENYDNLIGDASALSAAIVLKMLEGEE